jgi:hypothetical protein
MSVCYDVTNFWIVAVILAFLIGLLLGAVFLGSHMYHG